MFAEFLSTTDTYRVSLLMEKLSAYGFPGGALTGGLATELHLLARGRNTERRSLNDVDFVVGSFSSIPGSLAEGFLVHHIHPHAPEGKLLLQLIDREQALRIDLFGQFGATLTRTERLKGPTGPLTVISLEDLLARTTALIVGRLRRGKPIDPKHARAFRRLAGLAEPGRIDAAWRDHRQSELESFRQAAQRADQLLDDHPDLVIPERYSAEVSVCPECDDVGPFRRACPDIIVQLLGYW